MKRKIKKIIGSILISSLLITTCGCGGKKDGEKTNNDTGAYKSGNLLDTVTVDNAEDVELDDKFKTSTISSSFNIYNIAIDKEYDINKNFMLGTASILPALGMTANGANNETLTGMEKVVCPGMSIEDYNKYIYSFKNHLMSSQNDAVKFNMANSIWLRDGKLTGNIDNEFLKTDKKYYNADAYCEPFNDDTVEKINTWVKNETNDMIPEVIDVISPDTVMFLINAMAFEAEWEDKYKDSQVNEGCLFTTADGETQKVTMLTSNEKFYCETEDAKAVIKNYEGGDFSFVGILPNEDVDIKDFAKSFDGEKYKKLIDSKTNAYEVFTEIPEFSFDTGLLLNDTLKSNGMNDAFAPGIADFTNMTVEDDENLYIGNVIHMTHIELDRKGTKAAAVTVVEVKSETACPDDIDDTKYVILDRPFMFVIMDNATSIPLFIGVVNTIQ